MEVASTVGPPFPAVLEQPWALTLWTYYQLTERDRIKGLRRRIRDVNNAILTAVAFSSEPNKLTAERDAALAAARSAPMTRPTDDEWRQRAERLVAAIETGKVLDA